MLVRVKGSGSARFTDLVKAAGPPQVITLWTEPEEDREFMEAVRGGRVLTVRQENTGTRKDHGEVGFEREGANVYLVFPKSIKDFEGKRVVGIKYDLLAEPKARGPVVRARREKREIRAKPKRESAVREPPAPKPEPRFAVTLERTATARATMEVTARSAGAAKKLALEQVKERPFELSGAAVRTRVTGTKKMQ